MGGSVQLAAPHTALQLPHQQGMVCGHFGFASVIVKF